MTKGIERMTPFPFPKIPSILGDRSDWEHRNDHKTRRELLHAKVVVS